MNKESIRRFRKAVITGDKLTSGPVMTSWDSKRIVPAAANTPFKMQQIRFRPDRTRYSMGMFFQKLEVTIALPYNSTKGTYAEYVRTDFDTRNMAITGWILFITRMSRNFNLMRKSTISIILLL